MQIESVIERFHDAVQRSHIDELRRQNAALLEENKKLRKELARWPGRCLEHALKIRALLKGQK